MYDLGYPPPPDYDDDDVLFMGGEGVTGVSHIRVYPPDYDNDVWGEGVTTPYFDDWGRYHQVTTTFVIICRDS